MNSLPLVLENLILEFVESIMVGEEMNKFDMSIRQIKNDITHTIIPSMIDDYGYGYDSSAMSVRTNTLTQTEVTYLYETHKYGNKYENVLWTGEETNIGTLHNGERVLD